MLSELRSALESRLEGRQLVLDEAVALDGIGAVLALAGDGRIELSKATFTPHDERTGAFALTGDMEDLRPLPGLGKSPLAHPHLRLAFYEAADGPVACAASLTAGIDLAGLACLLTVELGTLMALRLVPVAEGSVMDLASAGELLGVDAAPIAQAMDALSLTNLELVEVYFAIDAAASSIVTAHFAGRLRFHDVGLAAHLHYPEMVIGGGLAPGSELDLRALASRFWPELERLPALALSRLTVEAGLSEPHRLALGTTVSGDWELPLGRRAIVLTDLDLDVTVTTAPTAATANLVGWSQIGGARCYAAIALPSLAARVGLEPGSSLHLDRLLADLLPEGFVLPPELAQLVVSSFSADVAPRSGEFRLAGRAESAGGLGFTLGRLTVRPTALELALAHGATGSTARLVTEILVDGAPFVFELALPEATAGLRLADGAGFDLTRALRHLLPEDIVVPEGLPALSFRMLNVKAGLGDGTFSCKAESDDVWALPLGDQLRAGGLKFEASVVRAGDHVAAAGVLSARLEIGTSALLVTCALSASRRSISFAQNEHPLDLIALMAAFAPEAELPAQLPGLARLALSGCSGEVDLASQRYTLDATAELGGLALGELTIDHAKGTVHVGGAGGRLDELKITLHAEIEQHIVPELELETITLELELHRGDGTGWQWRIGGDLAVTALGVHQTLRANASNDRLSFAYHASTPLEYDLGGVVQGSLEHVELALSRDAASGKVAWAFSADGSLKLGALPRVSGRLRLFEELGERGFAFDAGERQEPLTLAVDLVPGVPDMRLGGSLDVRGLKIVLAADRGWRVGLTSRMQFIVPAPSTADDALRPALELLHRLVGTPVDVTLSASPEGVELSACGFASVAVPFPVIVGGQVTLGEMTMTLGQVVLHLGRDVRASAQLDLRLPAEVNNVFGERDGQPRYRLISRDVQVQLSVDSKTGLGFELGGAFIDLAATGLVCDEVQRLDDGTERTWKRFELGPVSLRVIELPNPDGGAPWWHVDFGELGELALRRPRLSFDGTSFAASGEIEVVRELRVPLRPLRAVLKQADLEGLAGLLPDSLALLDLHLLHDDGAGGKVFVPGELLDALKDIAAASGLAVDVEALRPLLSSLADSFNHLPADLGHYLDVTIPQRLKLDLAIMPGAGLGLKVDVKVPSDQPIRALIPTATGLVGITLRSFSLGEILSGSVAVVGVDADVDVFDFVSLAASLLLPQHLTDTFTSTRALQQKLILSETLWFVILTTGVPIPLPVYFRRIGLQYYGLSGVQSQLIVRNTLADTTLSSALRGLMNVHTEVKKFYDVPAYKLPSTLFAANDLNLGITVEPGYVRLPKYLGGELLGNEQVLLELTADKLLVPVANFLKDPDPGTLLSIAPLSVRNGSTGETGGVALGPLRLHAAWIFSTLQELDELVAHREEQPTGFVTELYRGGESQGSQFVETLKGLVAEAAGGATHDGVVLYMAGAVDLPGDSRLDGFAGLLVERGRGALTQFHVAGRVGSVLALELGGLLSAQVQRGVGSQPPSTDLLLDGHIKLWVLGHEVLSAAMHLEHGDFAFAATLSLFPPETKLVARADVAGVVSRDWMRVNGSLVLEGLPLIALARTDVELTYDHVHILGDWSGQRWRLEIGREAEHRYRLSARAETPVKLLPGHLELTHGDDPLRGPALELTGPLDARLELTGMIKLPSLSSSGRGVLTSTPGRVRAELSVNFFDRLAATLLLEGESLDAVQRLAFTATFEGDALRELSEFAKAGFDQMLRDARRARADAKVLFEREWDRFTALRDEGEAAVRAGILESRQRVQEVLREVNATIAGVNELLVVNQAEKDERNRFLDKLAADADAVLGAIKDQVTAARRTTEAKRGELDDLDRWYESRNEWDRFWYWAYYCLQRGRLWIETEAVSRILWLVEQELGRAQSAIPLVRGAIDAVLEELDAVRAGLYVQLQAFSEHLAGLMQQLDHYTGLLLLDGERLLLAFNRTVDSTARNLAQQAFDLADTALDALEQAGALVADHVNTKMPFTLDRLEIGAQVAGTGGARFHADADVYFNILPERRRATHVAFDLDFGDIAASAGRFAASLWNQRDKIEFEDRWELRRLEQLIPIAGRQQAISAALTELGPDLGLSLDRLALDMDWVDLAQLLGYARTASESFPVLAALFDEIRGLLGLPADWDGRTLAPELAQALKVAEGLYRRWVPAAFTEQETDAALARIAHLLVKREPVIESFDVTPTWVDDIADPDAKVKLRWNVRGAVGVELEGYGPVSGRTSLVQTVRGRRRFTLHAASDDNSRVSATSEVVHSLSDRVIGTFVRIPNTSAGLRCDQELVLSPGGIGRYTIYATLGYQVRLPKYSCDCTWSVQDFRAEPLEHADVRKLVTLVRGDDGRPASLGISGTHDALMWWDWWEWSVALEGETHLWPPPGEFIPDYRMLWRE